MPLLYLSISWLAGIFTGSLVALPFWVLALAMLAFVPALFFKQHRRAIMVAGLCLLSFLGGTVRYASSIPQVDNHNIEYYNNKGAVQVQGMVDSSPETRKTSLKFRLSAQSVTADNITSPVKGGVLVCLPFYRQVQYGDILRLTGKLETPPQFDDFDYKNYLYNQGIYSILSYPHMEILDVDRGIKPLAWIYHLRTIMAESLQRCLPEPQASLSQAILLGIRENIPDDMLQSFYKTGTTHLIAISGLNLTIILGMVLPLTVRLLGRRNRIYIWMSMLFIWFYAVLAGLPPTIVRAAIMGSVFLLSEMIGRQRNAAAAMSFAAAVMAATDPHLLWDAGFQLSFLSMLGLVFISPYLVKIISPVTSTAKNGLLRPLVIIVITSFGTTMAAIVATLPLTALYFRSFSLVGAPATFFAMPSFPFIIVTSILTASAGAVWPPMGILFGWFAWLFISYFELIVNVFSLIPLSYITDVTLQPWQVIAYYTLLAGLMAAIKNWQRISSFFKDRFEQWHRHLSQIHLPSARQFIYPAIALLLTANIMVWTALAALPDGRLHVTVFDVGQGECILVRTADGQNIVLDTGPDPGSACTALGEKLPFWDRNIDLLILTQLQSDHVTGTFEILRRYNVKSIALPSYNIESGLAQELLNIVKKTSVKLLFICEGQQVNIGRGAQLAVLNPPAELHKGTTDDANNNSVATKVSWRNVSFLLASDTGFEAERYLMENRADLKSDILKVGHHGSRGSTCQDFLAIVKPVSAVISCGKVNRFGHPHPELMQRLQACVPEDKIFITAVHGNIEFTTDGYRLWRQCEKTAEKKAGMNILQ